MNEELVKRGVTVILGFLLVFFGNVDRRTGVSWYRVQFVNRLANPVLFWLSVLGQYIIGGILIGIGLFGVFTEH